MWKVSENNRLIRKAFCFSGPVRLTGHKALWRLQFITTSHFLNLRLSQESKLLLIYNSEQHPGQTPSGYRPGSSARLPTPHTFQSGQLAPGGHLPCMSKTGCRASWCRDQLPHSVCQGQTLFLSIKAHRNYNGLTKHSLLLFCKQENRRKLKTNKLYITQIKST